MNIIRRAVLKTGTLVGVAMLLMGSTAVHAADNPPIQRGGIIKASMYQQPASLYGIEGDATIGDHPIYNQIYDALLRSGPDGAFLPGLAESWEFSAADKTVIFNLRKGVVFHDGTPFNAEAVKYNIDAAMVPDLLAPHAKDIVNVESVEVVDEFTVKVVLKEANGVALVPFSFGVGYISSPTAMAKFGDKYGRNPVGTGPFKFVEWQSGEYIELERNENYWRMGEDDKALPYVDGVRMRFISSTSTKIIEVQGGNLDLTDDITPREAVQLGGDSRVKLVDPPPGGLQSWLAFNTKAAPFDNVNVRRAIIKAVNRDSLLKAVALGVGDVPSCYFAPAQWAYSDNVKQAAYDPAGAKTLLEEAGVAGASVELSMIQRDPDTQIAQIIQAQLNAIGLKVSINVMERGAYVQSVLAGEHQFALGRWPIPFGDPDSISGVLFGPGAALDWSNIDDPELEQLVVDGRTALTSETRAPLYEKVCAHVVDNAYYDFLMMRGVKYLANPNLYGWTHELTGAWHMDTAYFAE